MSFQHSWCQSEQSKCSDHMFEMSPFRVYTLNFMQSRSHRWFTAVNNVLIKTTPLFNQTFFQISRVWQRWTPSCLKSHSPPDWDLDCCVANPMGWWSRVSQLTVAQPSHGYGGLGPFLLDGEEVTRESTNGKEVSRIGNWDLWQQLERIENLVNWIRDSYEIWRRWQK